MYGPFPERLLTSDESVVEQFHPHWRTLLVPFVGTGLATAGATASAAMIGAQAAWLAAAAVAALACAYLGVAAIQRVSTLYVLTTERLIWRWGIVRRQGVEIPLEQINTVQFSQRLWERILRYGDLNIESAGSDGLSKFTDIPDPEGFQSRVYATRDRRKRVIYGSRQVGSDGLPLIDAAPVVHATDELPADETPNRELPSDELPRGELLSREQQAHTRPASAQPTAAHTAGADEQLTSPGDRHAAVTTESSEGQRPTRPERPYSDAGTVRLDLLDRVGWMRRDGLLDDIEFARAKSLLLAGVTGSLPRDAGLTGGARSHPAGGQPEMGEPEMGEPEAGLFTRTGSDADPGPSNTRDQTLF